MAFELFCTTRFPMSATGLTAFQSADFLAPLPVPPPSALAALTSNTQALNGTGLVLIVDDEELVLRLTGIILVGHGYQVLTALDGKIAVQIVQERRHELALVILDLIMPVMGGVEAFAAIAAIAPELPVILMTGYDPVDAVGRFDKDALAGFIQKPGSVPVLLQTVKAAIQRDRRGLN